MSNQKDAALLKADGQQATLKNIDSTDAKLIKRVRQSLEQTYPAWVQDTDPTFTSDVNILRFLEGNEYDVPAVISKMCDGIEYRRRMQVPRLRKSLAVEHWTDFLNLARLPHAQAVFRYHPELLFHGFDKTGGPVMITKTSMLERYNELKMNVKPEYYAAYRLARAENRKMLLDFLSQKRGKSIKMTYIWDMEDLNFAKVKDYLSKSNKAYRGDFNSIERNFYPETVERVLIVNAPPLISLIFKLFKHRLPERTYSKIRICKYVSELQQYIEKRDLPIEYGGGCKLAPLGWIDPCVDFNEGVRAAGSAAFIGTSYDPLPNDAWNGPSQLVTAGVYTDVVETPGLRPANFLKRAQLSFTVATLLIPFVFLSTDWSTTFSFLIFSGIVAMVVDVFGKEAALVMREFQLHAVLVFIISLLVAYVFGTYAFFWPLGAFVVMVTFFKEFVEPMQKQQMVI